MNDFSYFELRSKILSLGNAQIYLAFRSLFRIFARGKFKEVK